MIKFDKILGNPNDWEFTETEILEFCSGIENQSVFESFFSRMFQEMTWESDAYQYEMDNPQQANYDYDLNEESSSYLDYLEDLHAQDERNLSDKPYDKQTLKDNWKKLHGLDKKQVFKDEPTLFFDWFTSLSEEDCEYYSIRIGSGERLLSFDKINTIKEDKVKNAFNELLNVINNDFVRVSLNESDKSLEISSTNIDKLNSMVTKLQTLGNAFSQCDYTYKIKNAITVHYYTFKKI